MSTARERVYDMLKSRHWIAGYDLIDPEVGGTEGLRRLRELRAEGCEIKKRPIEGCNAYEYRLVSRP